MSEHSDFFSRITERVDVPRLRDCSVACVGVGSVGSALTLELARCGIAHVLLIDGDRLELHNPARHALPRQYVGVNKAAGMAALLRGAVPGIDVGAVPCHLDDAVPDPVVDELLARSSVIFIATDNRRAQRRIAARALALDVPAVVPALYPGGGGEVFVQLDPARACFSCWDRFRDPGTEVRGVASINADALGVIQQSVFVGLGLLDPSSAHAREFAPPPEDRRPRQLFIVRPGAALTRASVRRRPGCPGCAVGPSPLTELSLTPSSAEAVAAMAGLAGGPGSGWAPAMPTSGDAPRFRHLSVDETLVVEGGEIAIRWLAEGATRVDIDGVGSFPPAGTTRTRLGRSAALRAHAINPFGETTGTTEYVRVIPVPSLRPVAAVAHGPRAAHDPAHKRALDARPGLLPSARSALGPIGPGRPRSALRRPR